MELGMKAPLGAAAASEACSDNRSGIFFNYQPFFLFFTKANFRIIAFFLAHAFERELQKDQDNGKIAGPKSERSTT